MPYITNKEIGEIRQRVDNIIERENKRRDTAARYQRPFDATVIANAKIILALLQSHADTT